MRGFSNFSAFRIIMDNRESRMVTNCNTVKPHSNYIASFPGSPPQRTRMTFDRTGIEKSGGEPGTFYHVSDVKGREKVLGGENLIARGSSTRTAHVNEPRGPWLCCTNYASWLRA